MAVGRIDACRTRGVSSLTLPLEIAPMTEWAKLSQERRMRFETYFPVKSVMNDIASGVA